MRATSWPLRVSAPRASSNDETQSSSKRVRRLSPRRSRVRTKSSSSSSTSKIRTARLSRSVNVLRRQLDDLDPVAADVAHDRDQSFEADRLGDEGVRAEVVGAVDVFLGLRGGENDDRDAAQVGVGLDLAQRLAAVLARHVQVEEDEARRWRRARVGVGAAMVEVVEQG